MRSTDELELLQVTGIITLSLVVYSSGYKQSLFNDFLFCIIPQYYAIIYPNRIWDLYIFLIMLINYTGLRKRKSHSKGRSTVIDYLRFSLSVVVAIAIYAVDFSIFEKRFEKTEFFGISLMDIGVGSFIYNAGVMSYKKNSMKYLKSCPTLIGLGFVRYFVVKAFNIDVNPREYGLHLNFYFLLAFVHIVYCLINSKHNFLIGLCIITSYEFVLKLTNFGYIILSDDRRNLIEMNKEGLVAIIPYLTIFLTSREIGRICFSDDKLTKKMLKTLTLTVLFGSFYMLFSLSSEPSRRIGNGAFAFWVLTFHSLHITIYMFFENIFDLYSIQTSRFCSSNMMFVFLFSNLIVLFGNVLFNLKAFSSLMAHLNLLSYLVLIFSIPVLVTNRFNLSSIGLGYRSR